MKYIFGRDHGAVLARLASSRVLLAFDFDGTLAPIVADRDRAEMRARTRTLLAAACRLYPCAIISGRARADLAERLVDSGAKYVIGNHGIEPGGEVARFEQEIKTARRLLEHALRGAPGIEIEDKRYSLTVHYRHAPREGAARAMIDAALAELPRPMRIMAGKLVVNVIPLGARNKGDVLLELRDREAAEVALYVGDDVTDEDVFTLDEPGRLLATRIGKTTTSAARFYLRDQREIDRLLAELVRLRELARPPATMS